MGGAVEAESVGGRGVGAAVEAHPTFIQSREVTVLNIFTGFVGVATATTLIVQGNQDEDLASIRGGAFILLFAFTYLWVAFNGYLNAGGCAFGWVLPVCGRHRRCGRDLHLQGRRRARLDLAGDRLVRLGRPVVPFFVLLALDRPIGRVTGLLAIAEGIATSWVFGFLLLQGTVKF